MGIVYCKKCGRAILPIVNWEDGKAIYEDNSIEGNNGDRFCGICATTCFFINGEMYSPEEALELNKQKEEVINDGRG